MSEMGILRQLLCPEPEHFAKCSSRIIRNHKVREGRHEQITQNHRNRLTE